MTPRREIHSLFSLRNTIEGLRNDEIARLTRRIHILGAFLVLALLLMFVPSLVALAAPATQPVASTTQPVTYVQQWWMPLLAPVLALLGTLITTIVAALLKKLVKLFEDKYHVEVPASVERLLEDKAKQLIAAAEEETERKLLHGDGIPTPGAEKSRQVVDALLGFIDRMGYGAQYQEDQIKKLVDGVLHLNRAGSENVIGSNGERSQRLSLAASSTVSKH
jgi:hypothetical protein